MGVRIGVFVCHCGTNIGGVIDVPALVEYARTLEDVAFADDGRWLCSVDYLSKIKEAIAEQKLDRVVVACCTPRTHEPTFRSTLKEAGLNPYLLEFVSIREQSSWVHKAEPENATKKAKDLIRMGVAKARLLEPAEEIRIPVGDECLVVGGGAAGMTAALALADQGFKVNIVEKHGELGGLLTKLDKLAPTDIAAGAIVKDRLERINQHDNIKVHTNAEVEEVSGYVGNFKVKVVGNGSNKQLAVSTIIVATGMNEVEPEGLYGYGKYRNVITQLQLEELIKSDKLEDVKTVAFINCANSRNEERGCCNIGCLVSIKNAKAIKELNGKAKVYVFHRDLNVEGADVNYLKDAVRDHDIKLVRYPDEQKPEVSEKNGGLTVSSYDVLLGRELKIDADLVVLTVGYQGDGTTEKLKGMLKVSTNSENFFIEAHTKLRPLDFANEGIYISGCARSPKSVKGTVEEALGAAMRAAIPMKRGYVEAEGIVSDIDLEECTNCGLCAEVCPFGAIELVDEAPNVIKALCKGCGICVAECPKDCMDLIHFTDGQILAQIEAALAEEPEKKIVAFCCHWCALGAVDIAGISRFEYPSNIRVIRVMCSGRIDKEFVYKAFERGAAGVLVAGCEFPTCHYMTGNEKCRDRLERVKKILAKRGVDANKLRTVWLSAADGPKFVTTVKSMVEELGLGRKE